jgi:hypothetical protein
VSNEGKDLHPPSPSCSKKTASRDIVYKIYNIKYVFKNFIPWKISNIYKNTVSPWYLTPR